MLPFYATWLLDLLQPSWDHEGSWQQGKPTFWREQIVSRLIASRREQAASQTRCVAVP